MRDQARIKPFLGVLEAFWLRHPDWRFGQMVMNLTRDIDGRMTDPWNWEEEKWIKAISEYTRRENGGL